MENNAVSPTNGSDTLLWWKQFLTDSTHAFFSLGANALQKGHLRSFSVAIHQKAGTTNLPPTKFSMLLHHVSYPHNCYLI